MEIRMTGAAGSLGVLDTVGRMPARQLFALMVTAAATIAMAVGAWLWAHEPDYRVLYSNVADRDGGAIIAALGQLNIPYKFTDGGGAILVPAPLVHDTRLRLASQGLPKGGTVGFELMENQKLGATQFQEQVNYQRGLEGELAKSIQSLSAVQAARVHLAIPRQSAFLRDQQGPSASVLVSLHAGKSLDRAQVNGIRHLVASSVPDLTVASVSVIDQNGALSSGPNEPGNERLDPTQLAYVRQIEQATISRIESILEPMVGPNNARVQVSADVDFLRVESVAETFEPNREPKAATLRSQQTMQSSTTTAAGGPQGVPGALSNQPPAAGTASLDGKAATQAATTAGAPTSSRKDDTTSYEVDKTIKHTRNPVGSIKRLTAAVVVNFRKQADDKDKGKSTMVARPAEQLEQINTLVREAMGFNKDRGDSLNVVNVAFSEAEREPVAEIPLWKQPETISLAKEIGKYVAFAALLAYLFFGVLKPLLRRAFEVRALSAPDVAALPQVALAAGSPGGDSLVRAQKLAREDPKIVANVVKSWVTSE
jgi:flagellar M-ring protein FliF